MFLQKYNITTIHTRKIKKKFLFQYIFKKCCLIDKIYYFCTCNKTIKI